MNTIKLDIPEGAARASRLAALRRQMAEEIRGRNPHKVAEVHVCFGFSPYVNYGYHQDALDLVSSVDLTYMLMLSPVKADSPHV